MNFGYESGFKAMKDMYRVMIKKGKNFDHDRFERYTSNLLNRTCPGWIKK